jgi:hypothetical protein
MLSFIEGETVCARDPRSLHVRRRSPAGCPASHHTSERVSGPENEVLGGCDGGQVIEVGTIAEKEDSAGIAAPQHECGQLTGVEWRSGSRPGHGLHHALRADAQASEGAGQGYWHDHILGILGRT